MKRIVPLLVGLCLLMAPFATSVFAQVPPLPHAFYGTVKINDGPAPVGTLVEARGEGVETPIQGNPTEVTEPGKYGGPAGLDPKLVVQGDIEEGTTLTFYVDGVAAETAEWHSGEITELPLSVTIAAPPGGAVGVPAYYLRVDLWGEKFRVRTTSAGKVKADLEVVSADEMVTLYISKGVLAQTEDKQRLRKIEVLPMAEPPPLPENGYIIGIAYNLAPAGATFAPPIELEIRYDPSQIPDGLDEEDLLIAYYDEEAGEWVECECTCDPETHCITACVCHFTCFAIIGAITPLPPPAPAAFTVSKLIISPTEIDIGQSVTISTIVANTGGETGTYEVALKINGVVEATKEVTVSAGANKKVTFTTAKDMAGSYLVDINGLSGSFTVKAAPPPPPPPPPTPIPTPPEVKPAINWPLVGGIIAGVVVVGLGVFFWIRRRAA